MRKIFIINLILLLFCFASNGNAEPVNSTFQTYPNDEEKHKRNEISYRVTIDKNNRRLARVECRFSSKASTFSMNNNLAEKLPNGYAEFVKNLKLIDSKGIAVPIKNSDVAKWDLENTQDGTRILKYDVLLDHDKVRWDAGQDEAPYLRSDNIFWTGRALFIVPEDAKSITVKFDLPDEWGVSSPWEEIKRKSKTFKVKDFEDLTDSFLVIGTHARHTIKIKNLEMRLAIGEHLKESELLIKDSVSKLLMFYADFFKGTPKERLLLVMNSQDKSGSLDGGTFGRSISMLSGIKIKENNVGRWIGFIAHETFHLWNGELIRANSQEYWFSEGFTNYFADIASIRLGFINQSKFINNLEFAYKRYFENSGKISLRAAGNKKFQNQNLIYQGGQLVALALDLQIREATANKKSLDDVMRKIYKKFGQTGEKYAVKDILTIANNIAKKDFSSFFAKYIEGTELLPLETYLDYGGLKLINKGVLPSSNYAITKLLRIYSLNHTGMIIRNSAKSGFQDGDSLVAINDTPIKTVRDIQEASKKLVPGGKAEITVIRKGMPTKMSISLGTEPVENSIEISILPDKSASEPERLILSDLLNP